MNTKMTLHEQQSAFARDVSYLIQYIIADPKYSVTLGESWRSKEQAQLYAKQGKGIVNSLHCERLAIDLNLFREGVYLTDTKDYEWIGMWWEKLDKQNRWGGRFKRADGNHFERTKI